MLIEKEYESQSMLSEEVFLNIASDIFLKDPHHHTIIQVNQYMDTDDFTIMNGGKAVLRIRKARGKPTVLTLKVKDDDGKGITEYHQVISYFQHIALIKHSRFPKGKIKNMLIEMGYPLTSIKYQGEFKTKRYQIDRENYNFCVDSNDYNGIRDYNIEVEARNLEEARNILEELAKKYQFEITKNYIVKSQRFIKSKH